MKAKRDTEGNQKLWHHDGCLLELKITSVLEWVPRARKKCIQQYDRIPIERSDSVSIPNRRPGQGYPARPCRAKPTAVAESLDRNPFLGRRARRCSWRRCSCWLLLRCDPTGRRCYRLPCRSLQDSCCPNYLWQTCDLQMLSNVPTCGWTASTPSFRFARASWSPRRLPKFS